MTSGTEKFPDWLAECAATIPDRHALVFGEETWTFAELDAGVTRIARQLATLGVQQGDRVATLLHNGFLAAAIPHATLRLGATLVPLNTRLSREEIAWQIADVSPRVVIDSASLNDVDETDVRLRMVHDAEDVLAIIYTSGTTGRPKGAMLTVANFWWSAKGSAMNLGVHRDDRWLACMPLFHVGGLSIVIRSAIYGTAVVVHDGFDAARVNDAIATGRVTIVSLVGVMLERMVSLRGHVPYPAGFRFALLGGGPVSENLLNRCVELSLPVVPTYGLTEACSQVATLPLDDAGTQHGTSGKVLHPNELRIAVDASSDGGSDGAGEILVRGPIVMAGYAGRPEETSGTIVDGWLHTGDIGRLDEDGYLYVLDRRDDLIVTGGENVYPAEVERVLLDHPLVSEAGVVGIADPAWGQSVIALIRLSHVPEGARVDASMLKDHCAARLAGYKTPREFRFVTEALPRTASGKLKRALLRDLVAD